MAPRKSMLGKGNRPRQLPPPLELPLTIRRGLGSGPRSRQTVDKFFETMRREQVLTQNKLSRSKEKGRIGARPRQLLSRVERKENMGPRFQSSPIEKAPRKVARSLFTDVSTPSSSVRKIPEPPALLSSCVSKRFTCFQTRDTPQVIKTPDLKISVKSTWKSDGISRTQLFNKSEEFNELSTTVSTGKPDSMKKIPFLKEHLNNEKTNSRFQTLRDVHEEKRVLHTLNSNCTGVTTARISDNVKTTPNKTAAYLPKNNCSHVVHNKSSQLPLFKSRRKNKTELSNSEKVAYTDGKSSEKILTKILSEKEPQGLTTESCNLGKAVATSSTILKRKRLLEESKDSQIKRRCCDQLNVETHENKHVLVKPEADHQILVLSDRNTGVKNLTKEKNKPVENSSCQSDFELINSINLQSLEKERSNETSSDLNTVKLTFSSKATQTDLFNYNEESKITSSLCPWTDFNDMEINSVQKDSHIRSAVNNLFLMCTQQNAAICKEIENIKSTMNNLLLMSNQNATLCKEVENVMTLINNKEIIPLEGVVNNGDYKPESHVKSSRQSLLLTPRRRSLRIAARSSNNSSNSISDRRKSVPDKLEQVNCNEYSDNDYDMRYPSCPSSGKGLNKSLHKYRELQSDFQFLKTPRKCRSQHSSNVKNPKSTPGNMLSLRVQDQLQELYD